MLVVQASRELSASAVAGAIGVVPEGLPKPPARPPAEPIIIKVPPRPCDEPEVDRRDDDGIRRAPWMPDMPPPLPPEERPHPTLGTDHHPYAAG